MYALCSKHIILYLTEIYNPFSVNYNITGWIPSIQSKFYSHLGEKRNITEKTIYL